ncbi:MAG: diadenylate cyclase CdaA [Candidatus Riflebacteria bacterium]|nr:diadenylate cyclase CdaA [Candidatus Riflebacteria bacterium]MBR4571510.1 diadenylate cyclase CdaA [Candidatus Riflebacteria bacterium]
MNSLLSFLMAVVKDMGYKDIFDIILVSYAIYLGLRFIEGSRAFNLLKGICIIVVLFALSQNLNLNTATWVLEKLLPSGVVAIIIIFQPELRRAFEDIGKGQFLSEEAIDDKSIEEMASDISKALNTCSEKHVGALVIIEQQIGLKEYIDNGVPLRAAISSELLGSIFWPFSPLHDGAAIIKNNRIEAAGCFLPTVTNHKEVARELGSRHRAAISTSELTDALILIVSEETGTISRAKSGELIRDIAIEEVRRLIITALRRVNDNNSSRWRFYKK